MEPCPYCHKGVWSVALHVFSCPELVGAVVEQEYEEYLEPAMVDLEDEQ